MLEGVQRREVELVKSLENMSHEKQLKELGLLRRKGDLGGPQSSVQPPERRL